MASLRKRAKENLMWRREHHDSGPANKNAASTVWLYGTRTVNGIVYGVYTARPKSCHLHYAIRLDFAIKEREDTNRYIEAYRRYLPDLIRWQQERKR